MITSRAFSIGAFGGRPLRVDLSLPWGRTAAVASSQSSCRSRVPALALLPSFAVLYVFGRKVADAAFLRTFEDTDGVRCDPLTGDDDFCSGIDDARHTALCDLGEHRLVSSVISHLPIPQRWKAPATTLHVPIQSTRERPNPAVTLEKADDGRITVHLLLTLRIQNDEHERKLAIRSSEIRLWRWRQPFQTITIPVRQYAERGKARLTVPPVIDPLGTFDGWLRCGGEFPSERALHLDWCAWLVIHFRGFRAVRHRLVIDWGRPLKAWNDLIEYGLSQVKGDPC